MFASYLDCKSSSEKDRLYMVYDELQAQHVWDLDFCHSRWRFIGLIPLSVNIINSFSLHKSPIIPLAPFILDH